MRELRLIGVHDDGEHLLLTEDGDDRFTVPIDDALRSSVKRAVAGPSADPDVVPVPEELRPRDVQALLRAGVSVRDVAERAHWTAEKVERYAGPIRAEREHIAGLARAIAVSDAAAGRTDTTFGERAERRLDGRGVDPDDVVWDSWRGRDGDWTVLCSFPAGGRQRRATWHFDVRGRILEPTDDEARWLGEDEGSHGPLSAGSGRDSSVYDVEAEGGLNASRGTTVRRVRGGRTSATAVPKQPAAPAGKPAAKTAGKAGSKDAPEPAERPVDLVAAMRERSRNRRRKGKPAAQHDFPDDAAPREQLDTSGEAPPVGSHPSEDQLAESEPEQQPTSEHLGHDPVTGTADLFADLPLDEEATGPNDADDADDAADAVAEPATSDDPADSDKPAAAATDESDKSDAGNDTADSEDFTDEDLDDEDLDDEESDDDLEDTAAAPTQDIGKPDRAARETVIPDRPSSARKGRPSVPSWDDIMFGRRPGHD